MSSYKRKLRCNLNKQFRTTLSLVIILFVSVSFKWKNQISADQLFIREIEKSMMVIPTDSIKLGDETTNRRIVIDSFYLSDHEVSNSEYLYFLNSIKSKDPNLYVQMLPDTLVWKDKCSICNYRVSNYLHNPAYRNYPVVGVTYSQAMAYCDWLTQFYNKGAKRKYEKVDFRLPTEDEWIVSASEGNDFQILPWKGVGTQNTEGLVMANFYRLGEINTKYLFLTVQNEDSNFSIKEFLVSEDISGDRFKDLNEGALVTTEIRSYWPNTFGLYNMAGNVEEYVQEFGVTKGGSWNDPGYYMRIETVQRYDSANFSSAENGFRVAMDVMN